MVKYKIYKYGPIYRHSSPDDSIRYGGYRWDIVGHKHYHIKQYSTRFNKWITVVVVNNRESAEATLEYLRRQSDVQFNN